MEMWNCAAQVIRRRCCAERLTIRLHWLKPNGIAVGMAPSSNGDVESEQKNTLF